MDGMSPDWIFSFYYLNNPSVFLVTRILQMNEDLMLTFFLLNLYNDNNGIIIGTMIAIQLILTWGHQPENHQLEIGGQGLVQPVELSKHF